MLWFKEYVNLRNKIKEDADYTDAEKEVLIKALDDRYSLYHKEIR